MRDRVANGAALLFAAALCLAAAPACTTRTRGASALAGADAATSFAEGSSVRGVVFRDDDGDGARDADEPGLAGIAVSNGRAIVETDAEGRFAIAAADPDTTVFVLKPRGLRPPVDEQGLPRFFHLREDGSPLPESLAFALQPVDEPDRFSVLLLGDPQARNATEVGYFAADVLADLPGVIDRDDCAFGVALGDLAFDDLSVFAHLNAAIARLRLPWRAVLGNHDVDMHAASDALSDETFERAYGPATHAFDVGPVHFLVLDDVVWQGMANAWEGKYEAGLSEKDLAFGRADLARVPQDRLVVVFLHVPLREMQDRGPLFEALAGNGAAPRRVLVVSAHEHAMRHEFHGAAAGWPGGDDAPLHEFVNATACGNWWAGAKDEAGIPHATMRDGAPNGSAIATFDGRDYAIRFIPARRPADHQMAIHLPAERSCAAFAATPLVVNVFAGSSRSVVEARFDGDAWVPLERFTGPDPGYLALVAAEAKHPHGGRRLWHERAWPVDHLWRAPYPADLAPGWHHVDMRATDMFGTVDAATKTFFIE